MSIRYTSLSAALVVTNQKCPSHQPFMSTLPLSPNRPVHATKLYYEQKDAFRRGKGDHQDGLPCPCPR